MATSIYASLSLAWLRRRAALAVLACIAATAPNMVRAAQCPFDNGASDAVNDGLVLTRYALGITGSPLVASTKYASLDPLQVKNNIECVGCALDMNGDGAIDTVDTTIVARHLSGFTGASLTAGLALGVAPSASRPTTAAITSFLASGCALGGAINAWTLGGNAFGAAGVIGTNDAFSLTVKSGGSALNLVLAAGDGLRVLQSSAASAPNVINGSSANEIIAGVRGATIAGGGVADGTDPGYGAAAKNRVTDLYGTVSGGWGNRAGDDTGLPNTAVGATVSGGFDNTAAAGGSVVSGGNLNNAKGPFSTIGGGLNNITTGTFSKIGGGEQNSVSGQHSSVSGGRFNQATGPFSVVVGGGGNTASAHGSFIGGGGYCCTGNETQDYPNTVTGRGGSIVGGYQNSVAGAASFVGGGYLNSITGTELTTYAAAVLGGTRNTVSANYASVGGGSFNVASSDNSVIAGGESNNASGRYASVSGGQGANARLYGQTANAAGSFSGISGTAQATQYVLRNRTTNANQSWLYLDGVAAQLVFEPGRAGLLDVQVVGFAEGTGFSASYAFKCHYSVVTGGAAIQPTGCNKTVIYESEATWDANVSFAPGTTSAFGISVSGLVGRNIRWVATVRATEVSTL